MFEHWYKEVNNQGLYYKSILTVNSILGVPSPITVEKFLKKNCKYNQYEVLSKSSWETFKKFSKLYEPQGLLGICYVTIFGRVVYKKSSRFLEQISGSFWYFFTKSFLVARPFRFLAINIKSLIMITLEAKLKVPI